MLGVVYTCEVYVIDAFLLGGLEPFVGVLQLDGPVHAVALSRCVFMCAPTKHVSVATAAFNVAALFVCLEYCAAQFSHLGVVLAQSHHAERRADQGCGKKYQILMGDARPHVVQYLLSICLFYCSVLAAQALQKTNPSFEG